jgi:hypothetical protein
MATQNDSKFYDGQICSVMPIEHRFNEPNAFELAFEVGIFDENKQPIKKVDVYLEISMRYGSGNNSSKTQKDMTFETLRTLGFEGEDLSAPRLATLVNKPCRVREQTLDKTGKPLTSPRYYFTSAKPIVALADANAKLREIMGAVAAPGGAFGAPAAPGGFAAPGAVPPPNPFAAPAAPAAAPGAAAAGTPPNPFAAM